MTRPTQYSSVSSTTILAALWPIMAAVLTGFLTIGLALPVLPLHVRESLGYGSVVVGLVAGAQFAASLVSRIWAGSFADRYGAKRGVITGLIAAAVSGGLYLLSLAFVSAPIVSISILILGRALLGGAESFIITGAVSWGLGLVDKHHAGKVIAWVGTAMFAAMAFGGPFGTMMFTSYGFGSIAAVTVLLPLPVLAGIWRLPALPKVPHTARADLKSVMKAVRLPGLGAATASIGYCAILAFGSLFYAERHWQPVWLAFTAFGAALIVSRMFVGHLPDKLGGAKVALFFVLVQTAGLILMWLANTPLIASAGAAIAGIGYSLVYPGLGVEVVTNTSPENRGLAMGLYTAFLDVAMAIGSPVLGWIAEHWGVSSVFSASSVIVLCTACIAARLLQRSHVK